MNISFHEVKKLPVAIIDDFFDKNACEKIWKELEFLHPNLLPPEETGSAWKLDEHNNKIALKSNQGIFLDAVYNMRNCSSILKENRKIFDKELIKILISENPIFRHLEICNSDNTLLNYYENQDYYEYHYDRVSISAISWFYKKPRSFEGGELIFEDESLRVDCLYNRMVIFPSMLKHKVSSVKLPINLSGENYGRYSMVQFLNTVESKPEPGLIYKSKE
jgi:hypothetical protein